MTPPPEPRKPLARRLLDLNEKVDRLVTGDLQAHLNRAAQRRDHRERRLARRDWIWLAFMVVIVGLMVLTQLAGSRATLVPLAFVFSFCFLVYLMTLHLQRRIAARDVATQKGRRFDG